MTSTEPKKLTERSAVWKAARPFVLGGMSATTATCIVQPIDMVKVRMQLQGSKGSTNPFAMLSTIIKTEGVPTLYRGLSAGIFRQLTYGMSRLGIFQTASNKLTLPDGTLPFERKLLASVMAGGIGALIGTPADAALVRMQADTIAPVAERRGYKNVIDALLRMSREEGVKGFFSGAQPTVFRGLAMNVGMLTTYGAYTDLMSKYFGDGSQATRFSAGALSGWTAATMSLPFDFLKTRLQQQKPDAKGVMPYKGVLDCAAHVIRTEGPLALYAGYFTYVIRITPHIMLTWVVLDNLKSIGVLQ